MLGGWTLGGTTVPTWSATDRLGSASSGSANPAVTVSTGQSGTSTLTQCVTGLNASTTYTVSAFMKATVACVDNGPFFHPDVSFTLFWYQGPDCTGGSVVGASLSLNLPSEADGGWHAKFASNLTPFMGTLSAQAVANASCSTDPMSSGSVNALFDDLALNCASADGFAPAVSAPVAVTVTQTTCQ